MKITPLDIQQKHFQSGWRGYNPEEVKNFLDAVRSQMEALLRENASLKESLRKAEAGLEDFREREKALKDTLVMAQKMTEEIKSGAMKEAEIVLSEARLQSEQIIASAHTRLTELLDEIRELKSQRTQLLASLRATLETHSKLLDITEQQAVRKDSVEEKLTYLQPPRVAKAEQGR